MAILTELCQELRNWFDRDKPKWHGEITIRNGSVEKVQADEAVPFSLIEGQYCRIIGSVLNDGVHLYPFTDLEDETFTGSIWAMAVPPTVIALAGEIDEWLNKYGGVDSASMSPFNSESFGGYSYSKSGSGAGNQASDGAGGWQSVFANRLRHWRKI